MTHSGQSKDAGIRINKYLAQCGVASRRGADELVTAGRVTLNGQLVTAPGTMVQPADRVAVDNRPVSPASEPDLVLLVHKPVEVVTTLSDPQARRTVLDLLPPALRARRPVPVGRLDYFSEGLLLMTTDGDLCHRLTHPSHHVDKEYRVTVRPVPSAQQLAVMERGMRLKEGEQLAPVQVKPGPVRAGTQVLHLVLSQGVNRQVRRMCRDLGLTVLRLARVRQGGVKLGDLKPGQFRELTKKETDALRKSVGL